MREPIVALREWSERFGHTFTIRLLGTPVVMTSEPELIRELYAVRDLDLFASGIPASFAVLAGRESLFLQSGERHQSERKLLMPPFHGDRMRGWATTMVDCARRGFGEGGRVPVLGLTRRVALEVITRVVFGMVDEAEIDEFTRDAEGWARAVRPSFLFVPALQRDWLGLSPYARFRRASARVEQRLRAQLAATHEDAARETGRDDVLACMVAARYEDGSAMHDAAIIDQLRTLLLAGHDTTAVVLAWALHFVGREAEARERLLAELDALGAEVEAQRLAELPYLGAVIDETLRLRPVTTDSIRTLRKPWQLGPWSLPAGAGVSACAPLVHLRGDLWPEPERFMPERFLAERPSPNVYLPFGGGMRRCIGASFARFEACVVLGTLLREYEFEPLDERVEWTRGLLTLEPIGGVRRNLRRRQGAGGSGTTPART